MALLMFYVLLFKVYYATQDSGRPWWLWPAGIVFLFLDVVINQTVMVVLMVGFKGWTVTERMKEYKKIKDTTNALQWWRFHFAENLCLILNVFDKKKGGHC
jgi:hypothetical protein